MMRYEILHSTKYAYGTPVSVCHNQILLSPRESPSLVCKSAEIVVSPQPTTFARRLDAFGNTVHVFSIEHAHRELCILAKSLVEVRAVVRSGPELTCGELAARLNDTTDPGWLEAAQWIWASPRVVLSPASMELARRVFRPERGVLSGSLELAGLIYREFKYEPGVTYVHTSSEEVLRLRKGVCQDLAHVALAALRGMGIPARYVSGYLRTLPPPGKPRLVGADQSHAWFSVYCGAATGWVDIDPTNNCLVGEDHVPVAWGRDYTDVAPVRGVYLGGGHNRMDVSVDVAPV
jgi:transglutaminase-like putative cysteine protease